MGFKKVYKCLMDIFPQVDSRILKAVAIENSKDVDAAAEIVLCEILPYLSKRIVAGSSSLRNRSPPVQANEAVDEEESNQSRLNNVLLGKTACSSAEPLFKPNKVARDIGLTGAATNVDSVEPPNAASTSKFHENKNNEPAGIETDELILLGSSERSGESGKDRSGVILNTSGIESSLLYVNHEIRESGSSSKDRPIDIEDGFVRAPRASSDTADNSTSLLENTGEENAVAALVPSSSQEQMQEALRAGLHSESSHSSDSEKQESGALGNIEDDTFNPVVSRSSQTCRIDLLEEVIEDAKNNKKTLFQAMQSIMNLMREVELQEEASEQAKEECARGGSDILVKVEELKQMLPHAKEANDMHAGEVYGEKAILATEVRELQSRLHSLSEERDRSLSVLDEMHQTLEARQAAAKELMKAAEQEKLEKEESALNALAEQEAIMLKVVQESETLQQEAEENSKLREFLMDCGQIVDSLQGEISVICQDVRLLKEKFDERIPLSKSISSSQTSCILASSSSSLKSMASDLGPEQGEATKILEKKSPTPSVDMQSPKSRSSEEQYKGDDKELLDEGWEFFDDAEIKI
ncbi:hypothetical protein E1A91_D12G005500v1 [Gossypium mustelinum]|uniref:CUE domain-containing protein n=1 Tax=Gossypium mustelinum TaxID=34275 RepID=A0A5D2S8Z0_GOSMU|nr:hypothetical protein E1A91_D12G005500v1 [Gossypium mustelinum]